MEWLIFLVAALIGLCRGAETGTLECAKPHEVPDCLFACPPAPTCSNRRYALPCIPPNGPCTPQCVCADGYAKNSLGTCITFAQCDKCNDYTEYFACDGAYDENCEGSCHCNPDYRRDANNTCVSIYPPDTVYHSPPPLPHEPNQPEDDIEPTVSTN